MTATPAPGYAKRPDYQIALEPVEGEVRVSLNGTAVASTRQALVMREGEHPPRYYLPLADVDPEALAPNAHSSYCPFKGTARYWNVSAGGALVENGAWAYDDPYAECLAIAGLVAFYNEKFELTAEGG